MPQSQESSLIYLLAQIRSEVSDNRKENKEDREKIYELIEKIESEQEKKISTLGTRIDALEKKNLRWVSIGTGILLAGSFVGWVIVQAKEVAGWLLSIH